MNPRVTSVKPRNGYRLEITFTNGEVGMFDCNHLLSFGVFKALADVRYFNRVRAEGGTVVWPDEQDLCPDTVYQDSVRLQPPPG